MYTRAHLEFSFLPAEHSLRLEVADQLKPADDPNGVLDAPPMRTHEQNKQSGIESEESPLSLNSDRHPSKSNGRKRVDIFSRYLEYWDRCVPRSVDH